MSVAIVILAAGASTRMGQPKQLLKIGNDTMLERVAKTALNSDADEVYIVLGANASSIEKELADLPLTIVLNPNYQTGLSSSIVKGVQLLKEFDNILIVLADQPNVSIKYLNGLIKEAHKNPEYIIASDYNGRNGVPAIFPKRYYSSLLALTGDKGAQLLLNSKEVSIKTLKTSVNLLDIDTPEDYNNLVT